MIKSAVCIVLTVLLSGCFNADIVWQTPDGQPIPTPTSITSESGDSGPVSSPSNFPSPTPVGTQTATPVPSPTSDYWKSMNQSAVSLSPRYNHTALVSETNIIFYGGTAPEYLGPNDMGAKYDTQTDSWSPLPNLFNTLPPVQSVAFDLSGGTLFDWLGDTVQGVMYKLGSGTRTDLPNLLAPSARVNPIAVSINGNFIIWGGYDAIQNVIKNGHIYKPLLGWIPIAPLPSGITLKEPHGIAAGNKLFIWDGETRNALIYDTNLGSWRTMVNAPIFVKNGFTLVWTGTSIVMWGGNWSDTGYIIDLTSYAFSPISNTNAPMGRINHSAVWTGSKMIVWGGFDPQGVALNDGGIYDPVTDQWTTMSSVNAPAATAFHSASWVNSVGMVVWGGKNDVNALNSGGIYIP